MTEKTKAELQAIAVEIDRAWVMLSQVIARAMRHGLIVANWRPDLPPRVVELDANSVERFALLEKLIDSYARNIRSDVSDIVQRLENRIEKISDRMHVLEQQQKKPRSR
jgi:hypothetical protein